MPARKKAKKQATKAKKAAKVKKAVKAKKSAKTKKAVKAKRKPGVKKAATTKRTTKAKRAPKAKGAAKAKKVTKKRGRIPARLRAKPTRKTLKTVAVGDVVRFSGDARNQMSRYDASASPEARGAEAIEGIVCSIRNIATGKAVGKTRGDVSSFVLEIVHHQTFKVHYASDRNTGGPRGPENVRNNPIWARVREALTAMAAKKQYISSAAGGLSEEPLASLLDGWRVVKVKAESVESAM